MTGFASATRETELATVSVSVKSVNHRFLDVQFRLPQALPLAETALRAVVQKHVARGRVEVTAHVQMRRASAPAVDINEGFVAALAQAVETARSPNKRSGRRRTTRGSCRRPSRNRSITRSRSLGRCAGAKGSSCATISKRGAGCW
jgi:uncharacterized protein (TIGR00255 family)